MSEKTIGLPAILVSSNPPWISLKTGPFDPASGMDPDPRYIHNRAVTLRAGCCQESMESFEDPYLTFRGRFIPLRQVRDIDNHASERRVDFVSNNILTLNDKAMGGE